MNSWNVHLIYICWAPIGASRHTSFWNMGTHLQTNKSFQSCNISFLIFQGLAAVFNISLGIVSWWTSKESERYNRLIQLRVFVFCVNILHAYITGPIIYQNDDTPMLAPGNNGKLLWGQRVWKIFSRNDDAKRVREIFFQEEPRAGFEQIFRCQASYHLELEISFSLKETY